MCTFACFLINGLNINLYIYIIYILEVLDIRTGVINEHYYGDDGDDDDK